MGKQGEWVDFKEVKENVTMQMILDHYAVNWLKKNRGELRGRCPVHKGQGDRTFHVNLSKGVFNCFSCKARGNVLDLVAAMERCSVRDAALKLKTWFGVGESVGPQVVTESSGSLQVSASELVQSKARRQTIEQVSDARVTEEEPKVINPPLGFHLRVDHGHDYGLSRGLSRETLEHFGAGYCLSKGTFAGRFIIPLHNAGGELIGYAGRSLDDSTEPRYQFPSNEKGFYKSHLLFNLHRIASDPSARSSPVVVVEGFFDCMKIAQVGFPCVGLMGSTLSEMQETLLGESFDRLVLLLDGDTAGRGATNDCLLRLGRRCWVRAVCLPDDVQPDQMSPEELAAMLASI